MEGIKKEDIEDAIRKLRKKKSKGVDGIRNEAWKYANEKGSDRKIMNGIWKVEEQHLYTEDRGRIEDK